MFKTVWDGGVGLKRGRWLGRWGRGGWDVGVGAATRR